MSQLSRPSTMPLPQNAGRIQASAPTSPAVSRVKAIAASREVSPPASRDAVASALTGASNAVGIIGASSLSGASRADVGASCGRASMPTFAIGASMAASCDATRASTPVRGPESS